MTTSKDAIASSDRRSDPLSLVTKVLTTSSPGGGSQASTSRTTPTRQFEPGADMIARKLLVKVARPHAVGGYVLIIATDLG